MANATQSSKLPPDDMHWGISYLREDLQDLRQEIRAVHGRFDTVNSRLDSRFAVLLAAMIALSGIVIGAVFAILRFFLQ